MSTARVTLDSPVFAGRLRQFSRGTPFVHAPAARVAQPRVISDVHEAPRATRQSFGDVAPALPRQNRSEVLQRNVTSIPAVAKKRRKLAKPFGQRLLVAMASMVFMAGMAVAVLQLRTNKEVISQVRQNNAVAGIATEEAVSEEEPTYAALANHQVDPTAPRYVSIPSQKVFARVQRQGLDKTGALKAPGNVFNAGWYENSSKPGEAGATLLDGHVAGPTKRGVFYAIKNLKAGDLIGIERGDGKKFNYKVVKTVISNAAATDMTSALLPVTAGTAGLNLMTCTGQYDHKTGEYDQRVIVFAQQV